MDTHMHMHMHMDMRANQHVDQTANATNTPNHAHWMTTDTTDKSRRRAIE